MPDSARRGFGESGYLASSASLFAIQGLDHVLHVTRDGEEAIGFIQKGEQDRKSAGPDLLLLDMHLPKYNGEEILQNSEINRVYAQIPVVVMTCLTPPPV